MRRSSRPESSYTEGREVSVCVRRDEREGELSEYREGVGSGGAFDAGAAGEGSMRGFRRA